MLHIIALLSTFLVAVIYPLSFWISSRDPLKQGFHKFHTGLPVFLSGVVVVFIGLNDLPPLIKALSAGWFFLLAAISFFYWDKENPEPLHLSMASFIGAVAYVLLSNHLMGYSWEKLMASFLGGLVLCAVLFAMNLGHWYLNVHGLAMSHLIRSTRILGVFLLVRLVWDMFQFVFGGTVYQGEEVSIARFSWTSDGILIYLGLLFGITLPLVATCMALETLKLKNTQATTGILYVALCAVLIGDMTFKYYLIKFGVTL